MKAAAFDFAVADTVAVALEHLLAADAKPLAGGQSLGPMMNLRLARPAMVVELSRVAELRRTMDEGVAVLYGAATTHAEIEDGAVPDATPGWLAAIAGGIAYRAVRNRGTIGGSLAHADPAADWLVTLTALGAEVVLAGPGGERVVSMPGFVTGPFSTVLAQGEVVRGVRVPRPGAGARWGYWKFTRKIGEFAKASAAVLLDGARSRIAVGALEQVPILLPLSALGDPGAALHAALPGRDPCSLALHAVAVARAAAIASGNPQ
jgi:carbon-monoxide dehydrogenase medium subunit